MEKEISLLDCCRVLWRWRKHIILIVFISTLVAIIASLLMPNVYRSQATIVPIGGGGVQSAGVTSMAAQIGIGSLFGGLMSGSAHLSRLAMILKSNTLAERVINNLGLMQVFYRDQWDEKNQQWKIADDGVVPSMEDAIERFHLTVTCQQDVKDSTITINAFASNPEFSADLVNSFLKEFEVYMYQNTFTTAKKNRIFIEKQLEANIEQLLLSGKELADFYTSNRISSTSPIIDVDVTIKNGSESDKSISVVEKSGEKSRLLFSKNLSSAAGDRAIWGSPDKSKLPSGGQSWQRTEDLKKKIDDSEKEINNRKIVRGVPQLVYLQYLTTRGKLLGEINTLLTQQYEMAKIEEAREDINFQIIDQGRVPLRKFRPQRRRIVVTTFMMSFVLAGCYAFIMEYIRRNRILENI